MKSFPLLVGACAIAILLPAASAQQADPLQLRSWAAACSNCHGTNGIAQPGMDTLAGASRDDMTRKLLDFKAGRRPATIMHQLAKGYTDEQLEQIAGYFAAQKK